MSDELTNTEKRIAELVGRGYTNDEIANELNYTYSTVKNVVSSLYQKQGLEGKGKRIKLLMRFFGRKE